MKQCKTRVFYIKIIRKYMCLWVRNVLFFEKSEVIFTKWRFIFVLFFYKSDYDHCTPLGWRVPSLQKNPLKLDLLQCRLVTLLSDNIWLVPHWLFNPLQKCTNFLQANYPHQTYVPTGANYPRQPQMILPPPGGHDQSSVLVMQPGIFSELVNWEQILILFKVVF